jgi:hypothetical protein
VKLDRWAVRAIDFHRLVEISCKGDFMSADRSEIPGLDSSELKELKEKLITA